MVIQKLSKTGSSYYQVIAPDGNTQLLMPVNPTRIVVYFHGAGGDQHEPLVAILDELTFDMIARGWAVLSHYAHGDNWGNDVSLDDYASALAWAKGYTGVDRVDFIGQSMGGCCSLQMFAADPSVKHWVGIEPVINLQALFNAWAKASIKTAYGFSNDGDYPTATAGHDPMLLDSEAFRNRKLWFNSSAGDTFVTEVDNSAMFFTKLDGIADMIFDQSPTGEHGDPSHFNNIDGIIEFLRS